MTTNASFGLLFLLLARIGTAADTVEIKPPQHVRNFGEVNENILRGGLPTDEALRELRAFGVNVIVDLRENGPNSVRERRLAEQLGMRYEHIPLSGFGAPTQADIKHALSVLLGDPKAKIYVHCLRGKDRTGTVIACYRIQHDRWDPQKALEEAKSYGMSSLEWRMQAFIRSFTPLNLP